MFLSKLPINVTSRQFRRDVANVQDMHRTVMKAFPDTEQRAARHQHGVLWRLDRTGQGYVLYVQSQTQPSWDQLPQHYLRDRGHVRCLQPAFDAIQAGATFSFRLVANPTRRIRPENDRHSTKKRNHNRRVPLLRPDEQISWIARQAQQRGFVLPAASNGEPDVTPMPLPDLNGYQQDTADSDRNKLTILPIRYDGRLVVTDPDQLTQTVRDGIGPAKAYGCGLMSLAPAAPAPTDTC